jgi:glycerol-3-phosphate O-acyltransferase
MESASKSDMRTTKAAIEKCKGKDSASINAYYRNSYIHAIIQRGCYTR